LVNVTVIVSVEPAEKFDALVAMEGVRSGTAVRPIVVDVVPLSVKAGDVERARPSTVRPVA